MNTYCGIVLGLATGLLLRPILFCGTSRKQILLPPHCICCKRNVTSQLSLSMITDNRHHVSMVYT